MFGSLLKAVVGVVTVPIAAVVDVATLNTDPKKKTLTEKEIDNLIKNIDKALGG